MEKVGYEKCHANHIQLWWADTPALSLGSPYDTRLKERSCDCHEIAIGLSAGFLQKIVVLEFTKKDRTQLPRKTKFTFILLLCGDGSPGSINTGPPLPKCNAS